MGVADRYNKKKKAGISAPSSSTENMGVADRYNAKIALTAQEKKDGGWFKAPLFDDGYDFGDVTRTILGTVTDIEENVHTAVFDATENLIDTTAYLVGGIGGIFSEDFRDGVGDFIAKDLLHSKEAGEFLGKTTPHGLLNWAINKDTENASVLADKSDQMVQSGAHLVGQAALQAVGVPWWLTSTVNSFGSEIEGAFQQGATYGEAGLSGAITAGAEVLTEKLSGGIKFGGKALDDVLTDKIAKGVSNKIVKSVLKFGLDATGEGLEEIVSGYASAIGQKMTYMDDKELNEIFSSEDAIDAFIGGAILGGGNSAITSVKNSQGGRDPITALTANEQKVLDSVLEERIAEAEKDGKKLTKKEKNEIYDQVQKELKKGYISTDTIERVLGGDTYKTYRDTVSSEDALIKEYEELRKMKKGEMNDIQQDRLAELKAMNLTDTTKRDSLKAQLRKEVYGQLTRDVKGKTQTDNYLLESYNEQARRGKAFEADVSKYSDEQAAVVQKAIDSGILNDTKKTHEFVDMIAKISADKGVPFDFANNEKIKESGFALEGVTVNGVKTNDGIMLNINSAKHLNTVVGHEITHVLEGTELYGALQAAAIEYAKTKGEYDSRYKALENLYKNVEGADINAELTADLIGDYLFTDEDFIRKLSAEHRNVFQKIYDEIKYLCKIATAGSKEARQLEKVKRVFDKVYRENVKTKENTAEGGVKYSLSEQKSPTYEELVAKNPIQIVKVTDGIESGRYADMKTAAIDKAKSEGWFDMPHHNEDTDSFIFLTAKSFTHAYSNLTADFGEDTIRSMAHISEIIKESVLVNVADPKDSRKNETKVYTFFGAIEGINGIEPVKLTVKEFDLKSLASVPQNIRNYFEKNGISEKYNSLYDAHALEVIGIEGIKKESDASGKVGEIGSRAQATSDSTISIADLLSLVKGDAEKYIPKKLNSEGAFSLSSENTDIGPIGNYNVFGKDIEFIAPMKEDFDAMSEKTVPENENLGPVDANVSKQSGIGPIGTNASETEISPSEMGNIGPLAEDLAPAAQNMGPVAEDAKTGQMSESFDDQNAIRYNLDGYSQHQKDNWKNSKRIVLCEGIEHFRQFIRNALSGNTQTNKKMYFGTISSKLAEDIENATGANVKGYNLSLAEGEIRKISKSHGDEKTEAQRGQRAITEDDYLNIPQIVQSPDSITLSPKLYEGKPVVEFRKTNGNETSTVAAVVSDKRLDLFVQTTFINKKSGDIATPKSVQADSFTPKATGGTAPVDTSNVSNDSISQNAPNVNINSQNSSDIQNLGPVGESEAKKSDGVQRKWVGTATDSQAVGRKILPDDLNQELTHYQPISNKKTLGKANTRLDSMGYDASLKYFDSQFSNNKTTVEDIVLGERLMQEAIKRGDTQTSGKLLEDIAILGTELGQKVQALSIIKRLTPAGQIRMLERIVERGKTKGDKAFEGVEITQEMIDHILKTYGKDGTFDQAELNKAVEDVKQQIADKMKVTKLEKVNAWRYLSMLGNPKTHIRNLVSTVAMRGTLAAKNAVARTIEGSTNTVAKLLGKDAPIKTRTKTWKRASEEVKTFSKNTALKMKDIISDGGKYSEEASIKEKRAVFKNKILNGVYGLNNNLLSKEDWWFSKSVFEKSLSEYLTANGINTTADIANNPEVVEKAKQYAIEQSQIATFRQYSWLANKISEMERHNTATNIAIGAVLPFKKTPINIAKTALNYSPLGFTKTLTYDISQVKNGKMEASTLVDHLSQNLTGTALTLVGYLLASAGLINGAGGDDKESKYDYQLGEQAYSINIGDSTFSLSWLSPIAMPLFVGANAYEQLVEGKEWNGDVVVETLAQTLDPLSEMSFLSSLDDVLSSYDSGFEKFAGIGHSMISNYTSQFIPTLSSQFAAVMDDKKRTTKVAGDSGFKLFDEIINNLKYKIPGLRNTLEPSTDIWGNEVKQTENIIGRAFESFLAPYSRKENIASEVDAELKTLYSETGDDGLIPSIPYNYVNYKNEKYEMSAEDYTAYKKTYGQTAYELLEELFNTDTYQYASAEERADMVNKVYDYARDEAKRELLAKKAVEYTNSTLDGVPYYKENSIYGAIENDMTAYEYEIYRQSPEKYAVVKAIGGYKAYKRYSGELNDIKGDKDKNGNTVSGSRKEKVIEYINGLDADYGEKIILFKSEYKSDNTYNRDILEYLNSREDISYEEMVAILTELGFKIGSDGKTVRW